MAKKSFVLAAIILFLALCAFAGDNAGRLLPGVPVLSDLPAQRMLVITAQGDPDSAAGPAFARLTKAFYSQAARADKRHAPAPRARWATAQLDSAKALWIGTYGMPVTGAFPQPKDAGLRLETWEYGLTAQILHVGPYDAEEKDIAALKSFIAANGLAIQGPHEEEYVKGPGRLFKGDPARYRTVIRYPVARIGETPQHVAGNAARDTAGRSAR